MHPIPNHQSLSGALNSFRQGTRSSAEIARGQGIAIGVRAAPDGKTGIGAYLGCLKPVSDNVEAQASGRRANALVLDLKD